MLGADQIRVHGGHPLRGSVRIGGAKNAALPIMAAALLRMGLVEEAEAFARWYAGFQAADGNVPCAVDRKGADWLVEHDSHGELIFAVAECFRFTGDRAFVAEMASLKADDSVRQTLVIELAVIKGNKAL